MNLKIKSDWLLEKAEKEGDGIVSAGGLVSRIEEESQVLAAPSTERAAFAQLVEWQRRRLGLSAAKADVEAEDILAIEKEEGCSDPRTIYKLADVFKLPSEKLMLLAGLVSERDPHLEKAAVRFAARSASIEALTPEQTEALEEFVKILAE
jgi:hypothetical protein